MYINYSSVQLWRILQNAIVKDSFTKVDVQQSRILGIYQLIWEDKTPQFYKEELKLKYAAKITALFRRSLKNNKIFSEIFHNTKQNRAT